MTRTFRHPGFEPAVIQTRGPLLENVHLAAVAVVDAEGRLLAAWGDPMQTVFMRSSAKPFQALPFVVERGPEQLGWKDEHIALMVSSHDGRPMHTQRVQAMLASVGLDVHALQCGVHPPLDPETARELACRGQAPTPLHHNCSGKHAGFLARARVHGWDIQTYLAPDHPVQRAARAALARMSQWPEARIVLGTDGCSAPNFALPLYHAAWAWARLADPRDLPEDWARAARRIVRAMVTHPHLVAGPERFDTRLMQVLQGRGAVKGGAAGYQALGLLPGVWPDTDRGVGIVIKMADPDRGQIARGALTLALLTRAAGLDLPREPLETWWPEAPITNYRGIEVGQRQTLFP
ncbi:MAG: asparaginase [Chloroflexi bacterium]|nr:asparaginase [Chloroflexota bacterium]